MYPICISNAVNAESYIQKRYFRFIIFVIRYFAQAQTFSVLIPDVRGDRSMGGELAASILSIGLTGSSKTGVIAVSIPAASHHILSPLTLEGLGCSDSPCLSAISTFLLWYAARVSRTTSSFVLPGRGAAFTSLAGLFHPDQNLKLEVKLLFVWGICFHGFSREENSQHSIAACEQRHIVDRHRRPKGKLAANLSSNCRIWHIKGTNHIPM